MEDMIGEKYIGCLKIEVTKIIVTVRNRFKEKMSNAVNINYFRIFLQIIDVINSYLNISIISLFYTLITNHHVITICKKG